MVPKLFFTGLLALLMLTRAYALDTVKETEQLDFAQGLLSRGMYDMAIVQYQKFIADNPHSPSLEDAYLSLAEGYFLSQDFGKAQDAFNQFNRLFPKSEKLPASLLRLAQIDIEQQKYDDALKELTSIDPQNQLKGAMLQAFDFYTAEAYLGKNDNASALSFFQKAAQTADAVDYTAEALGEAGKILGGQGHFSDALDAYNKAIPSAKDDLLKQELVYRKAEVYFLSGQYAQAIKGFEDFMGQYPGQELAKSALANLLSAYFNLKQFDQLLSAYDKYAKQIKDDESYFNVHLLAVLAMIELNKYAEANSRLDHMLAYSSLKPNEQARIFIQKAAIMVREQKYKDALALLDAYSSQDPDEADESFFLKAQCYYGLNDFDKAFNFFENVYLNFPNSRFAKAALLGEAHTRQAAGRFKESAILFSKYYDAQDQPDLKGEALYDEVIMADKAGDGSKVVDSGREYLKSFPSGAHDSEVVLILADSLGKNNQPQEAVKLLQDYLGSPAPQQVNAAEFLLGFNQQLLGNSKEALAAYKEVDPQKDGGKFYDAALKNMAIIYLTRKDFDKARAYFDQLITQANDNDLQLQTYVWVCNEYLKRQKYDDVLRVAAQAEKRFSSQDLSEVKYFEAEAQRGMGHCDEAGRFYDAIIAAGKQKAFTASAHIGRGLCLETAKKFDDSKAEFQKALDENSDDATITAHARFEIANTDALQGSLEEALKYYILVATIYDNEHYCSESLLKAGQVLERLKRGPEAKKMYAEILEKYPNSPAAVPAKERMGVLK